jgi:hypothetical protein
LIQFVLFQVEAVAHLTLKQNSLLTLYSLNQSLLAVFNLLSEQDLLLVLCERSDYSTLVSYLIKNIYLLVNAYFLGQHDESLINIPSININYANRSNYTSDMLFTIGTLSQMLKMRFILTSHRSSTSSSASLAAGGSGSSGANSSMGHDGGAASSNTGGNNSNVHLFLQPHYFRDKIPFNMRDLCDKIYLNLCRLPVLDRFMRIPDALWRMAGRHFHIDYAQLNRNDSTTLPPLDYLRDPLILREHLRHILSVGWTSRAQFEYEYVNLLTLLHNLSDDYYMPMSTSRGDLSGGSMDSSSATNMLGGDAMINNLPAEEIKERNKAICLVIKGIDFFLLYILGL